VMSRPFHRHPGESRGPFRSSKWIPAFAEMTAEGEWTFNVGIGHTSRALAQISFSRILIGPEASAETSPPFAFRKRWRN
jgi:hypothetical protein